MSCSLSEGNVRGMGWPWVVGGFGSSLGCGGSWGGRVSKLCAFVSFGRSVDRNGGRAQAKLRRSV